MHIKFFSELGIKGSKNNIQNEKMLDCSDMALNGEQMKAKL